MAHGLSCSAACGIFLGQGLNPCPLHWQVDSSPLCHQGSPTFAFISFALGGWSKKMLLRFMSKSVSSRSFMVSGVTFRSLNHFEFLYMV